MSTPTDEQSTSPDEGEAPDETVVSEGQQEASQDASDEGDDVEKAYTGAMSRLSNMERSDLSAMHGPDDNENGGAGGGSDPRDPQEDPDSFYQY
jgi:hypothetical protein